MTQAIDSRSKTKKPITYELDKLKDFYRPERIVTLEGTELRYVSLSNAQSGIVYEILIIGIQDSVSTPQERTGITKAELLQRCVQQFITVSKEFQADKNSVLHFQLISQMLLEPKVNNLLYKLISEVFPEIKSPYLLKNEKTMMLFAFIIEEFAKSINTN